MFWGHSLSGLFPSSICSTCIRSFSPLVQSAAAQTTGNLFALSTLSSLTLYIFLKYQIRPSAWKLDNLQICCFFVNSIFVKYRNMFIYIHIWHVQQLASGSRLIFGLIKHVVLYQNNMVVCCFGFLIQSHSVQVHKGLVLLWYIYFIAFGTSVWQSVTDSRQRHCFLFSRLPDTGPRSVF